LGYKTDSILNSKRLAEVVRYFDRTIKPHYNPFDSDGTIDFEVPIPGVADIPDIGLKDGYLMLTE
jgi:hypothetical protein